MHCSDNRNAELHRIFEQRYTNIIMKMLRQEYLLLFYIQWFVHVLACVWRNIYFFFLFYINEQKKSLRRTYFIPSSSFIDTSIKYLIHYIFLLKHTLFFSRDLNRHIFCNFFDGTWVRICIRMYVLLSSLKKKKVFCVKIFSYVRIFQWKFSFWGRFLHLRVLFRFKL